jgi:hypothetical protein
LALQRGSGINGGQTMSTEKYTDISKEERRASSSDLLLGTSKIGDIALTEEEFAGSVRAARNVGNYHPERRVYFMRLGELDLQDYARQLFEAQGYKAIADAAQKASDFEKQGSKEGADTWRPIETVLLGMRGPHAT